MSMSVFVGGGGVCEMCLLHWVLVYACKLINQIIVTIITFQICGRYCSCNVMTCVKSWFQCSLEAG